MDEREKIEVTQEMIEAGGYWLDLYKIDQTNEGKYLAKIFTAMEVARIQASKHVKIVDKLLCPHV